MSGLREIHITIFGNPITKKNSMRIVQIHGRPVPIPSEQYKRYEKEAKLQLMGQIGEPEIDYPVNVACLYFMQTKRKVDITNLLSATHDVLVASGVLADDNSEIVVSVDGSRVYHDKENPRTEIIIIEKLPFED